MQWTEALSYFFFSATGRRLLLSVVDWSSEIPRVVIVSVFWTAMRRATFVATRMAMRNTSCQSSASKSWDCITLTKMAPALAKRVTSSAMSYCGGVVDGVVNWSYDRPAVSAGRKFRTPNGPGKDYTRDALRFLRSSSEPYNTIVHDLPAQSSSGSTPPSIFTGKTRSITKKVRTFVASVRAPGQVQERQCQQPYTARRGQWVKRKCDVGDG